MEAGGPMRKKRSETPHTLIGKDPDHLPHSGGHMMSSLGKELSDQSPYAKSHAERQKGEKGDDEKV